MRGRLLLCLLLLLRLLVLRGLNLSDLPRRADKLRQSYCDKHQHLGRVLLHCALSVTDRMLNMGPPRQHDYRMTVE